MKPERRKSVSKHNYKIEPDDFGTLCICAIRYCQGRETYMPDLVRSIIRPFIKDLTDRDIRVMVQDCEFQERFDLFGNENIDKPGWIQWRKELEEEKQRRGLS